MKDNGVWNSAFVPVVVLFALAAAVRLLGVGQIPIGDENITYEMIRRFGTLELLWNIPRVQPHFPLYYVLLDIWGMAFPLGKFRAMSLLAGTLVPVVTYLWFRNLVSEWRAFLASLFLVFSPVLVVQSRWLRMYALLVLFVVLSWWAAWRWLNEEGRASTYGLLGVVVIGLHPFGLVVVATQIAWLTVEQWQTEWKGWFRPIVGGLGVLLLAPTLWLLARIANVRGTGTIDPQHMHIGYASKPLLRALVLPITTITGTLHNTLFLVVASLLSLWLFHQSYSQELWKNRVGRLCICWVFGSVALLYIGQLIRPVIMLKYVGWLAPGVALWIGVLSSKEQRSGLLIGSLAWIVGANLLHSWVLRLSTAMVAIWNNGVL